MSITDIPNKIDALHAIATEMWARFATMDTTNAPAVVQLAGILTQANATAQGLTDVRAEMATLRDEITKLTTAVQMVSEKVHPVAPIAAEPDHAAIEAKAREIITPIEQRLAGKVGRGTPFYSEIMGEFISHTEGA